MGVVWVRMKKLITTIMIAMGTMAIFAETSANTGATNGSRRT